MDKNDTPAFNAKTFAQQVTITVGITLLFILLVWFFGVSFDIFLLIVAALLIALPMRAGAKAIHKKIGLKEGLALLLVVAGVLGALAGIFWLLASRISGQLSEFQDQVPQAINNFKQQLSATEWGQQVLKSIPDPNDLVQNSDKIISRARGFLSGTFGALSTLYGIIFMAAFILVDPTLYRQGIIRLVPKKGRKRAGQVLDHLNTTLVHWLMGQLFSMTVVGTLTFIGLLVLGVRLAGVLALFAGLITFIPNLGPIIALVPAVLFAFLDGPQQALHVIILYMGVQFVESSFATPLAQKKLIDMPPALVFGSQLVLGSFGGILGLMLATPIVAMLMVLTQMVYVQDILADETMQVDS